MEHTLAIEWLSLQQFSKFELISKVTSAGTKIVTAISKYTEEDLAYIKKASEKAAILSSPNITLGINWMMMTSMILKKIIPLADIEIVEEHFRDKNEVSGTALKLANQLDIDPVKHVNSIRVGSFKLKINGCRRLVVATGLTKLPVDLKWKYIIGVSFLAGIGFTMSIFISNLALPPDKVLYAKMGILIASAIFGLAGYSVIYFFNKKRF